MVHCCLELKSDDRVLMMGKLNIIYSTEFITY